MAGIFQTCHSPTLFKHSSSSSFTLIPLNPRTHFFPLNKKPLNFTSLYSSQNPTEENLKTNPDVPRKKRKPRPSFYQQISEKWSVKPISQTKKFPWQLQEHKNSSEMVEKIQDKVNSVSRFQSSEVFDEPKSLEMVGKCQNERNVVSGVESFDLSEEPMFDSGRNLDPNLSKKNVVSLQFSEYDEKNKFVDRTQIGDSSEKFGGNRLDYDDVRELGNGNDLVCEEVIQSRFNVEENNAIDRIETTNDVYSRSSWNVDDNFESKLGGSSGERLPWMNSKEADEERRKRSKTELAEKTIPEHELKRLRNIALRTKERIKVGVAGVTQAVVDEIHDKWKVDEVVKLKFEGPPAFHMKRSHQVLESKTGGLVIWRSGSSVVIYRGLTYKLDCVNTYMKEKTVNADDSTHADNYIPDSVKTQEDMSQEELKEMREIDKLLDGLGPRYRDWSGRPPLPVDADLLPGFVLGYKIPFRCLPHGVQRSLTDSETTKVRRQARFMPAHFALGRNRELQGLAAAMVKLWEKSALAKIAIKRGVLNTRNERMAEELKRLTGGTLLSRNKEFIVFYRGNDFMPPPVTESLREREQLTMLQFEEEEARRYASDLVLKNSKKVKVPLVAGTLTETVAATSRWAKHPDSKDIDRMIKDSAVARRASLVKYLQHKQAIANGKLKKAEKALEKVQKYLAPEDLPTDLETITDEERLVFRRMGLSMKPFLLLGRREVFDGTIENMHLHWKYRELVKIVVKGKNFAQVKHIAISLEAESGGVIVSIDKSTKGYDLIFYRGKNYRRPLRIRPRNLLTRRQALARSIELQRRESLKHHISNLQEQMELVKCELDDLEDGKELDDKTFYEKLDDSTIPSDDEMEEDEDEEAYLLTYDSSDERGVI